MTTLSLIVLCYLLAVFDLWSFLANEDAGFIECYLRAACLFVFISSIGNCISYTTLKSLESYSLAWLFSKTASTKWSLSTFIFTRWSTKYSTAFSFDFCSLETSSLMRPFSIRRFTPNPYSWASFTTSRRRPSFYKNARNSVQLILDSDLWSSFATIKSSASGLIWIFCFSSYWSSVISMPLSWVCRFAAKFLGKNSGKYYLISISSSAVRSKGWSFWFGKYLKVLILSSISLRVLFTFSLAVL